MHRPSHALPSLTELPTQMVSGQLHAGAARFRYRLQNTDDSNRHVAERRGWPVRSQDEGGETGNDEWLAAAEKILTITEPADVAKRKEEEAAAAAKLKEEMAAMAEQKVAKAETALEQHMAKLAPEKKKRAWKAKETVLRKEVQRAKAVQEEVLGLGLPEEEGDAEATREEVLRPSDEERRPLKSTEV